MNGSCTPWTKPVQASPSRRAGRHCERHRLFGLVDTFFETHALHGLHGRRTDLCDRGLKLARPELTVVVVMGDGGLGIGGAHFLAACRRNLDMTLLILNNFNFGMTGGQPSVTTPQSVVLSSGFLHQLEEPLDPCATAGAAGASWVYRCSGRSGDLPAVLEEAIRYGGFAVVDVWGLCTGRYAKRNRLGPEVLDKGISALPRFLGEQPHQRRPEYGRRYRETATLLDRPSGPLRVTKQYDPPDPRRNEVVLPRSARSTDSHRRGTPLPGRPFRRSAHERKS